MSDYTEYPIPHYVYDDGVTKLTLGPGFETEQAHQIYKVSDAFLERIQESFRLNEARFCPDPTCKHHKDVFPKYASIDEKQVTYQEMLTVVLNDVQPVNARELACAVHLVYAMQAERVEATKPFIIKGNASDFIQQFMGNRKPKQEIDPEQAVQDLLRDIKEEGASKHTLDPWATRFNETGENITDSFGISHERYQILQMAVATLYRDHRDDKSVEIHQITAKVFNKVVVLNGGEREFRSWLCGMLSELTVTYRSARDVLGGIM